MRKHIQILGALYIAHGFFRLVWCLALPMVIPFIVVSRDRANWIVVFFVVSLTALLFILLVAEIIAGVGLLKFKSWSRIFTLILNGINLFAFPIGTALGIYGFIILFSDESIKILAPREKDKKT
ncbi:MAG: hypothetical protein ACE5WD_02465 [Candidatus Aminicenantia bacterium]